MFSRSGSTSRTLSSREQYLTTDIDDMQLDQTLVKLLSGRFDLCADFKRLFVYGDLRLSYLLGKDYLGEESFFSWAGKVFLLDSLVRSKADLEVE